MGPGGFFGPSQMGELVGGCLDNRLGLGIVTAWL